MFDFIKRHRLACAFMAVDVIILLIVALIVVYNNAKSAVVDIYVAPSNALIELNGEEYDNFSSQSVFPGDYHVKISMDGMQTKEFDLSLNGGGFGKVRTYLVGTDGGFGYYVDNPDEEMVLAEVANDKESKEFVEKYNHTRSILNDLPLEYYDRSNPNNPIGVFVEQDTNDCKGYVVCLVAYGGKENSSIVEGLIREAGFEPSEYRITYGMGDEEWNE